MLAELKSRMDSLVEWALSGGMTREQVRSVVTAYFGIPARVGFKTRLDRLLDAAPLPEVTGKDVQALILQLIYDMPEEATVAQMKVKLEGLRLLKDSLKDQHEGDVMDAVAGIIRGDGPEMVGMKRVEALEVLDG